MCVCRLTIEVIVMGRRTDEVTRTILQVVRETYSPAQMTIFIDPEQPSMRLAEVNETVRALLDVQETVPSVRICEGGVCGLPLTEMDEIRRKLRS